MIRQIIVFCFAMAPRVQYSPKLQSLISPKYIVNGTCISFIKWQIENSDLTLGALTWSVVWISNGITELLNSVVWISNGITELLTEIIVNFILSM
jgi:hypothetical protein